MIMRAMERDAELLKVRAVLLRVRASPRVGRRGVMDGIVVEGAWLGCCWWWWVWWLIGVLERGRFTFTSVGVGSRAVM